MKFITKDLEEVSSILAPLGIVGLFSYMCGSIFMGIFELAVTTNLTCLAIDIDLHGEDNTKWGPPTFHNGLEKIKNGAADENTIKESLNTMEWLHI